MVTQPPREVVPVRQHPAQCRGGGQELVVVMVRARVGCPGEEEAPQTAGEIVACWRRFNSGGFHQRGLCLRAVELKSSKLRKY